jgi:DNA-binding IclR family transcriptional regulator
VTERERRLLEAIQQLQPEAHGAALLAHLTQRAKPGWLSQHLPWLASLRGDDSSRMYQLLERLESEGMVTVSDRGTGRRHYSLTTAALALVRWPPMRSSRRRWFARSEP